MLDKMQDALRAMGAEVTETLYSAGEYYDGEQHGETFPCVFVVNDRELNGFVGCAIRRTIERYIRRNPSFTYSESHSGVYDRFRVSLKADADRAAALNLESAAFLEAFWQAIHVNPAARENNAALAILAGREAVKRLHAEAA